MLKNMTNLNKILENYRIGRGFEQKECKLSMNWQLSYIKKKEIFKLMQLKLNGYALICVTSLLILPIRFGASLATSRCSSSTEVRISLPVSGFANTTRKTIIGWCDQASGFKRVLETKDLPVSRCFFWINFVSSLKFNTLLSASF